ncbi:MAG TPA: hypothetical protein VIR27_10510 [Mycobacteriales bacterium]
MHVAIAVTGEHPNDELPSLRCWLAGDDDLTGLVDTTRPVGSGADDTIAVNLDRPGATAALADSLVSWIRDRDRDHDAVYEVRRSDAVSVRVSARRVRATGGAMVRDLIAELCRSTAVGDSDGDIDPTRTATASGPR